MIEQAFTSGKHLGSKKGARHVVNPSAKPSRGRRPKPASPKRSSRNTKADR